MVFYDIPYETLNSIYFMCLPTSILAFNIAVKDNAVLSLIAAQYAEEIRNIKIPCS